MLIAFHTSHYLHTKGQSGAEKKTLKFYKKNVFPKSTKLDQSILQRLHNMSVKQTIPKPKTNRRKTRFYSTKFIFYLKNFF